MPRLIAVCTCSRSASSRTAARVTRATMASEEIASAIAGSVRWLDVGRGTRPPLPSAGNQPSCTANTRDQHDRGDERRQRGGDARWPTRVDGVQPAGPQPGQDAERDAEHADDQRSRTAPARRWSRCQAADQRGHVLPPASIEMPRLPCSALASQYQYWARNGCVEVVAAARGRRRWPAAAPGRRSAPTSALPGARYSDAEDHEAGDQQAGQTSIASRRSRNLRLRHQPTCRRGRSAHGANM